MARAKVDFSKLKKQIKEFENSLAPLEEVYKSSILASIQSGTSPVRGEGRFQKYSQSYINKIKRDFPFKNVTPVNMTLSGQMLSELDVKASKGKVTISINDEVAVYHDKTGAGKSETIRRLLPQKGEKFTASITVKVREVLDSIVSKIFR